MLFLCCKVTSGHLPVQGTLALFQGGDVVAVSTQKLALFYFACNIVIRKAGVYHFGNTLPLVKGVEVIKVQGTKVTLGVPAAEFAGFTKD